jgi:hypothetical protein
MILQVVKMTDEVTVSSLPHPISMFLLGVFGITTLFMFFEVQRFKKDNEHYKSSFSDFERRFETLKLESEQKYSEISKKVDSRVDKALLSIKKNKQQLND